VPGFWNETNAVDGGLRDEARFGMLGASDQGHGAFDELWSHWMVCGFFVSLFSQVTVPPGSIVTRSGCQAAESWA